MNVIRSEFVSGWPEAETEAAAQEQKYEYP